MSIILNRARLKLSEWTELERKVHDAMEMSQRNLANKDLFRDVADPEQVSRGAPTPFILLSKKEIDFIPPDLALSVGEVADALSRNVPTMKGRGEAVGDVIRVQGWRLGGVGEKVLVDDVEETLKKKGGVNVMLSRQRHLFRQMSDDARTPMHLLKPIPENSLLFPLVQMKKDVGERVLENWADVAGLFEKKMRDIMVVKGIVRPEDFGDGGDYRVWTDLIKEMGLTETEVAQGFGAESAEAFVKNVMSFTAEHLEHLGSTAVNYFPLQHQGIICYY